jgi:hypothetical protein
MQETLKRPATDADLEAVPPHLEDSSGSEPRE